MNSYESARRSGRLTKSGRFHPGTPFSAGLMRFAVERKTPAQNIPVSVWYPSNDYEKRRRDGIYDLSAARDGKPARGPFGLIAISHGSGGSDINHHNWAEHLARHGYVVVAPRHVGDSHDVRRGLGSREQLLERPRQLRAAIDAVLTHPVLGACADRRRIGLLGFSAGGYTVLTLLGARPDYSRWSLYCQAHPDPSVLCPLGGETAAPDPGDADWEVVADHRVKAAVLLAPFALLFDAASLARVWVPLRIYRAEDESVSLNEWNADAVAAGVSGPAALLTEPGDHYVFIAPVAEVIKNKYPEFYVDKPGVDRGAVHRKIGGEILEFFDRLLPVAGKDDHG